MKDTEGNTNLVVLKKVESEEENKEGSNKILTVSNTKRDALSAQLEQLSDKLYSLQQRVQKLEKDQKEFDTMFQPELNRLSTDEKQIKLYMPKEAANLRSKTF